MSHGHDQTRLGAHALREFFDLLGWIERERLEQLACVRRIPRRMEGLRVAHQLVDAHPLRQLALLGEVADATQHTDRIAHRIAAEHAHGSRLRAQQAEQVLDQGCLARAVGAYEAVDLPFGRAECDFVERLLGTERSCDLVDVNYGVCHRYFSVIALDMRSITARRSRITRSTSLAVKFS